MVGIIILNYNNWEDTINCIESVEKFNTAEVKYIVIDNGSTRAGTVEALDKYMTDTFTEKYQKIVEGDNTGVLPYMTFLVSQTNDGYAKGNNKGLRLCYEDPEIDELLILNNDILFIQDIIPSLVNKKKEIDNCGIISPILYGRDKKVIDYNCAHMSVNPWVLIHAYLFFYRDFLGVQSKESKRRLIIKGKPELLKKDKIEIELPSGSCMMMSKALMQEIGGFDPNTFLFYEEDILHKKLSAQGLKNYLITSCECIHLGACSTSKTPSAFALTKQFESSIYYLENYCKLSRIQKALLSIGKKLFRLKLKMIRILK